MARSEDERRRLKGVRAVKLRFKISAYSPATMPMARLARYLDNLATVLGETKSVHLVGVEDGSTIPVLAVEYEAYRKVRQRASEVRNCEGSEYVLKARRAIEDDLAADDAEYAELVDEEGARICFSPAQRVPTNPITARSPSQAPWTACPSSSAARTTRSRCIYRAMIVSTTAGRHGSWRRASACICSRRHCVFPVSDAGCATKTAPLDDALLPHP